MGCGSSHATGELNGHVQTHESNTHTQYDNTRLVSTSVEEKTNLEEDKKLSRLKDTPDSLLQPADASQTSENVEVLRSEDGSLEKESVKENSGHEVTHLDSDIPKTEETCDLPKNPQVQDRVEKEDISLRQKLMVGDNDTTHLKVNNIDQPLQTSVSYPESTAREHDKELSFKNDPVSKIDKNNSSKSQDELQIRRDIEDKVSPKLESDVKEDIETNDVTSLSNETSSKLNTTSSKNDSVTMQTAVTASEEGGKAPPRDDKKTILERVRLEALEMHNIYRANHGVPPLVLNDKINQYSQKWAEQMAKMNKLEHSPGKSRPNYGENIYYRGSTNFNINDEKGGTSITAFYDEIKDYDYNNPGQKKKNGGKIGHFTQVIWKDSKELGVGMATTKKGKMEYVYICCNYYPPGNWVGNYAQNVPLPLNNNQPETDVQQVNREDEADLVRKHQDKPPPPTSKETPLQRVRREMLWKHNECRERHGVSPLIINNKINQHSQKWAEKMATTKAFKHSSGTKYTENIFTAGSETFKVNNINGIEIASVLCDGLDKDSNIQNHFSHSWNTISSGFTELAWKNSKEIGIGMATNKSGTMGHVYICCNYN